jgi:dolichol-phosphate mannosyltransferase
LDRKCAGAEVVNAPLACALLGEATSRVDGSSSQSFSRKQKDMQSPEALIFIPTYNEADNVERLCRELTALELGADILFCDDGSPDGTGTILDRLATEFSHVSVIHRPGKSGIGSAHKEGIRYAYQRGYQTLLTMDCDFTHQPADVRRLLETANSSGRPIVVGSRYKERDSLPGWNLLRRSLTYLGHFLTVYLLRLPYDATGALRIYQLNAIPRELFERVASNGYSFFFESLLVLHRNGLAVEEMPIALPARTYGHSKMSLLETFRSTGRLLQLFFGSQWRSGRRDSCPIPAIVGADVALPDPQGWDSYWTESQDNARRIYSFIASLYRRLAIKRNLNYFIRKHFGPGARLLHAGCGSGQVDSDLSRDMRITAVDISLPALESYRRNNPGAESVRHGNILNLSDVAGETFDGAYNLGVVEHFSQDEIVQILREMNRTVKPGGKVVIFWPHRRATSVIVLKVIHWLLDWLLPRKGSRTRLHPAEISLLRSRRQAKQLVEEAGFKLIEYHFGLRDLLVQAVVVGCKL